MLRAAQKLPIPDDGSSDPARNEGSENDRLLLPMICIPLQVDRFFHSRWIFAIIVYSPPPVHNREGTHNGVGAEKFRDVQETRNGTINRREIR